MSNLQLGFQCPLNGVPCIAIYDEAGSSLLFTAEYGLEGQYEQKEIDEANQWCMYNGSNCDSIEAANRHLLYLGVNERFDTEDDVLYVVENFNV